VILPITTVHTNKSAIVGRRFLYRGRSTRRVIRALQFDVSNSGPTIRRTRVAAVAAADAESFVVVAVLNELLTQSIRLRDLYKHVRSQLAGIQFHGLRQMLDDHYQGQLHLIDVLIDRTRTLGGARSVFAGDFLQGTQFSHALRGRRAPIGLLRELLDAHESVLIAARPSGGSEDHHWMRDFAVGHVVLTNDLQSEAVSKQLAGCAILQRYLQAHAHGAHAFE
jgi:starvation-inducible DNA-binding protein